MSKMHGAFSSQAVPSTSGEQPNATAYFVSRVKNYLTTTSLEHFLHVIVYLITRLGYVT